MTIYVVMVEDRHTDTESYLFSTIDKALNYAHRVAAGYDYTQAEAEADENSMSDEDLARAGWLLYFALSPEGDCLWVLPKEIDEQEGGAA